MFQGDDDWHPDPNIIFFVDKNAGVALDSGGFAAKRKDWDVGTSKVVRRSEDGRQVVREHFL
jgi:hypothetical protein